MTGELYEVLVLGAAEATPWAEARLAAALAGRNGTPLTSVAQALSDKNLSVGQGLDRAAAQALVHELQAMGALTSVRRATSAFPLSGGLTPPPSGSFRPMATPSGPLPALGAHGTGPLTFGGGSSPSSSGQRPPSGLSPLPGSAPGSGPGLRPLEALRPSAPAPVTPAPGARIQTNGLGHRVPTGFSFTEPPSSPKPAVALDDPALPAPRPAAAAPARALDPFSTPDSVAAPLELDCNRKPNENRHAPSSSVAGASGLNVPKMSATSSGSGLDLAGEKRSSIERCNKHGLLFDSRKSSACRKCLTDGRAALGEAPAGGLRASPGRRALLGLLFALVLGFLPAAYYSRQVGSVEVNRLRSEQQALSRGVGNDSSIRRFEEIEGLVTRSQQVNMRNTLIIWLAAGGVLMVGWYRMT